MEVLLAASLLFVNPGVVAPLQGADQAGRPLTVDDALFRIPGATAAVRRIGDLDGDGALAPTQRTPNRGASGGAPVGT